MTDAQFEAGQEEIRNRYNKMQRDSRTTMQMLYSIDPGKHRTAVAAFRDSELVGVYFTTGKDVNVEAEHLGQAVMELPRVYPGSPVRQNDLIDLTAEGMSVAAKLSAPKTAVKRVEPSQWKGQAPKEVIKERIMRRLTLDEMYRLCVCLEPVNKSLQHNLFDAIGIGLYALKRARKGMGVI